MTPPDAALAALEAQNVRLREENKRLYDFAGERHQQWRDADNIIHTMSYPEADADLVDAAANEIDCQGDGFNCEHGYTEHDTNAHVCSKDERADDALGCRWTSACQLRDLAKALRERAAIAARSAVVGGAGA